MFTFIFRIHFKENLSLKWILESCHFCSFFCCFSCHFSKCCKIPLVKRGDIQFPRFETNRVFFIPQEAQVHQNINLPFFPVLYPLGSRHSVCFFSFTQYDFILNEITFFHSELIYFTMIFRFPLDWKKKTFSRCLEMTFPCFFHFLQRFHTILTNQSYSKVCPEFFFPRSNNWRRRLKPHSFSFWWLKMKSFPHYFPNQFNCKRNSQRSKHSKKSSNLPTPNNKSLFHKFIFYSFLLSRGKLFNRMI